MSERPRLDFWFEFASTYSYLSVMRIDSIGEAAGVAIRWRPFLLGPIFAEHGWNDSPFNIFEDKGRYMWRDLERLCEGYGLPFRKPSKFPRNGLLAARVACVAGAQGWAPELTRAVFSANFAEDRDIGEPSVVVEILEGLGRDPSSVLAAARETENKERLRAQTDEAKRLGIFGAPSFVSDGELFWGNDRLGNAIAWARGAR